VTRKRKRIWIDRFQTLLSLRLALYLILYQFAVWAIFSIQKHTTEVLERLIGPGAILFSVLAWSTGTVLAVLFILDTVRLVHRVVGPVYRFRQCLKALAAGEEMEKMRLRKDDFLQELKDEFNEMLEALERRGAVTLKPEGAAKAKEPAVPA
jgi:hypothetical protein